MGDLGRGRGAAAVVAALIVGVLLPGAPAAAQVSPAPNPPLDDSCGVDVTLVLDASGSVDSAGAVGDVRDAAEAFLDALADTASRARVVDFGTVARETAPSTLVTTSSLTPGGVHAQALAAYHNPIPPIVAPAQARQYRGGDVQLASSFSTANRTANQYTNWPQALSRAGTAPGDLVVFVTDGDPTAFDFNQPGDPFSPGQVPPNVAYRADYAPPGVAAALERSVQAANAVKAGGARMLVVGVGEALDSAESQGRLVAVSGSQVVDDPADIGDLNTVDVALIEDFSALSTALRRVVTELCSPSLTIRKLAQTADSAQFVPAAGWETTVTPTVDGGTFDWILPDTDPAVSKTVTTDADGFAQFQWEPQPPTAASTAVVSETPQPGFEPLDYRCDARNPDGSIDRIGPTPLDPGDPTFTIPVGAEQIVTCTLRNSFDYQPDIALAKVNSPTEVRGDLSPPATVTSSYEVMNPGNTPLAAIALSDDQCGPVVPVPDIGINAGDDDGDGLLDTTETWQFTCTREVEAGVTDQPLTIVNSAQVSGRDPTGQAVAAFAGDDVEVITPAITLEKLVSAAGVPPAQDISVVAGSTVTYTYTVTNPGNVALASVVLADDQPPCASPTLTGGDDDGDGALDVDETWTYTCTTAVADPVLNTATVSGTPIAPAAEPGPPVSATDDAEVHTVLPDLTLTKAVDADLVLPGTTVTYTYTATNTGTADLRNPLDPPGSPSIPPSGWVADDGCAPVTYVSGDVNGDGLLNAGPDGAGETWQLSCATAIPTSRLNRATIVAETTAPEPTVLTRTALEFVEVVSPAIDVTKMPLRGVVVDPAAAPVAGPDAPTPRPAAYTYAVSNPGGLPLDGVSARLSDDTCAPLTFLGGDDDGDALLGPDEVWDYDCSTTLEKADGVPPDEPISSLVVNTVTVAGTPVLDGTPRPEADVAASDIASVLVTLPSLTLTKAASAELVRPGSDVTYTFEVANTGDVGLDVYTLEDDQCLAVTYSGGDVDGNGLLDGANSAAPETWTYTCTREVGFPSPSVNTATVTVGDGLGNLYEAEASDTVSVFDPAIELVKRVSAELVPLGSSVTYTFEVSNAGQSPVAADDVLADIDLVDTAEPSNPACAAPAFVGGDANGDARLDRDEVWSYTCTGVVDAATVDLAEVSGTDIGGSSLVASDLAFVQPFRPGVAITKTAVPSVRERAGEVTYTYAVTNTGDVPLAGVAETIADDTCSPSVFVGGDDDGDGQLDTDGDLFESGTAETWVFTCTTEVSQSTVNTVEVVGTPVLPDGTPLCPEPDGDDDLVLNCDATASATATVDIGGAAGGGTDAPGTDRPGAGEPGTPPPLAATGSFLARLLLTALALLATGALAQRAARRSTG